MSPVMPRGVVVLAATALAVTACALQPTFRPRLGGPGGPSTDGTVLGRPAYGTDTSLLAGARERQRRGVPAGDGVNEQRVCRTSTWPRGWIAVAYQAGASQCPGRPSGDTTGAVAVIVRYDNQPVGARLDVCQDQPVPYGWDVVRDEAPDDPDACPGAAGPGKPTTQRIRRDS